jgi:hypothetical protein
MPTMMGFFELSLLKHTPGAIAINDAANTKHTITDNKFLVFIEHSSFLNKDPNNSGLERIFTLPGHFSLVLPLRRNHGTL